MSNPAENYVKSRSFIEKQVSETNVSNVHQMNDKPSTNSLLADYPRFSNKSAVMLQNNNNNNDQNKINLANNNKSINSHARHLDPGEILQPRKQKSDRNEEKFASEFKAKSYLEQ